MDDGMKTALLIGVPLTIGAGVILASIITGQPAVPPGPPPVCNNGETQVQICSDGSQVVTYQCVFGQMQPTGNQCPPAPPPDLIQPGTVNYIEIIMQPDGTIEVSHYDHRFGVVRSEYFRGFSVDLFKNAWTNIYASNWEAIGEINQTQKANSILQAEMM